MQEVLIDELGGKNLEFSTRIGETSLAQVHFTVHTVDPEQAGEADVAHIQARMTEAVRTWDDRLVEAVFAEQREQVAEGTERVADDTITVGAESATEQGQRFASVFPEAYKEDFGAVDGARRPAPPRGAAPTGRHGHGVLHRPARRAGGAPLQALPRRRGRHALPGAAGAAADGRRGRRRAARTSCAARTARSGGSTTSACASTRTSSRAAPPRSATSSASRSRRRSPRSGAATPSPTGSTRSSCAAG